MRDFKGKSLIEKLQHYGLKGQKKKSHPKSTSTTASKSSKAPQRTVRPKSGTRIYGRQFLSDGGDVVMSLNMRGILGTSELGYRVSKAAKDIRPELSAYAKDKFEPFVPKHTGHLRMAAEIDEGGNIHYSAVNERTWFNYAPFVYTGDWLTFHTPGTAAFWDRVAWQNGSVRAQIIKKAHYLIRKELQ